MIKQRNYIVTSLGGRLSYLQHIQKISDEIVNSDDICGDVKKALFSHVLSAQKLCILKRKPERPAKRLAKRSFTYRT